MLLKKVKPRKFKFIIVVLLSLTITQNISTFSFWPFYKQPKKRAYTLNKAVFSAIGAALLLYSTFKFISWIGQTPKRIDNINKPENPNKPNNGDNQNLGEGQKQDGGKKNGEDFANFGNNAGNKDKSLNKTLDQWILDCKNLPKYSIAKDQNYANKAISEDEFVQVLVAFANVLSQSSLNKQENWIGADKINQSNFNVLTPEDQKSQNGLLNVEQAKYFVHKLKLPANAEISMHADIHSDVKSLVSYLEDLKKNNVIDSNFKIIKPNFYLAFLGDYTDRGCYGAEVLYTIARLKIANPENVILIRGNHEDLGINDGFGLMQELEAKFPSLNRKESFFSKTIGKIFPGFLNKKYTEHVLSRIYNLLPSAVFVCQNKVNNQDIANNKNNDKNIVNNNFEVLKKAKQENAQGENNYAILCHGGMALGFNPNQILKDPRDCVYQAIGKPDVKWLDRDIVRDARECCMFLGQNDFAWVDINSRKSNVNFHDDGRGNKFGNNTVVKYLKNCSSEKDNYKVSYIFRGHQHNGHTLEDMIKYNGLSNMMAPKQWDGKDKEIKLDNNYPVWTLNVCPDSSYGQAGGYNFDNHTILKLSDKLEDWRLEPHKIKV